MIQTLAKITERRQVADGIHLIRLDSAVIAQTAQAGQFLNIRFTEGTWGPLLRRPFSISRVDGNELEVVFNVIGTGTRLMSGSRPGDRLDLLGPLGRPFGISGDFSVAVLIGGGLGIAPLPFLTQSLHREGKSIVTFVGARTGGQLYLDHLENLNIATDDGSKGFHGTNVSLLEKHLTENTIISPKLFACGPTPMMHAVAELAKRLGLPCEVSLEGDMACGMGICQGCPVERTTGEKKYALVCHDGPTFECREVNF